MVTGGHIAFQRTAGLKRHTHDDQQRSTTQLDGGAGDVAEDDGEASNDGQEDRADQSDLGQGLRDEIAGGLARTDAGNGTVVFAKLVGNVHGVVLDRNVEVVERDDQQHVNDEVKNAVVVKHAEESVQRRMRSCIQIDEPEDQTGQAAQRRSKDDGHNAGHVHFDGDVAGLTTIHLAAHNALGVLNRDAALCVRQDDDEEHSDQSQDNQQRQHDVEERLTVLVVTHNKDIVNAMRKRVVTMHNGKIISDEKEGGYHEA